MKNLKMLIASTCLMLFVTMAMLTGCKKNEVPTTPINDGINKKKKNGQGTNSAGDGKNDLLGYGYDLTGEFANSSAAKFSVINVDKLKLEQPTRVEWDLSSKREGVLIAGENATSYLEKVTAKLNSSFSLFGIGKLLLFKASISGTYSDSDAFSSKYLYSSYSHKIQQKRVKLNATNTMLKDYLTSSFTADVTNESPAYIVSRYGTHVLSDIILGAKLEVLYRSTTTKTDRINASTAGVDVGVKAIFSINTGFTYDYNSTTQNFSQTLHYKTIGGEPSTSILGNTSIISANPPTVNISDWEKSSSLANAEMIDITENGLIPIWDLIADPVKSEAVKTYVIQYLKDSQAKLIIAPHPQEGLLFDTTMGGIYYVFSVMEGKARHIQDPGTLKAVYTNSISHGSSLASLNLEQGLPIPPGAELLRDSNNGKVYFMEWIGSDKVLRHILSPSIADKYRFNLPKARNINGVSGYTIGSPLQ